ncbi:MAG: hypothetical protein LBL45_03040 [Treponema sp.]|nr:hypothetical protein [Treponema sp.]
MAGSNSWLPTREQDFVDLCEKWMAGLSDSAQITAFGWNQAEVEGVKTAIDGFLTARSAYRTDNSTQNRMLKDDAGKSAKNAMKDFARYNIRFNRLMTEEQKLYYGVRTADPVPTPTPKPTTFPEAEPDTSIIRQVTIHFWDSGTKKRGKPHGVHGAEIRWAILDHAPASVKELANSDFDTATPFTLVFDESQRGGRLYFCLRWETSTNLKGPDGEIFSAVIP